MKIIVLTILIVISTAFEASAGNQRPQRERPEPRTPQEAAQRLRMPLEKFVSLEGKVDQIREIYTKVFTELGYQFELRTSWKRDADLGAPTEGDVRVVSIPYGLYRFPPLTKYGLALIVCHEIGHHLAGGPQNDDHKSIEGQSDYFGTGYCMRTVFSQQELEEYDVTQSDDYSKKLCEETYRGNRLATLNCLVSTKAGLEAGYLAADEGAPSYDHPDQTVVTKTNPYHPNAQCRVDTFLAGALCRQGENKNITDYMCGGDEVGSRPKCWYKEGDE